MSRVERENPSVGGGYTRGFVSSGRSTEEVGMHARVAAFENRDMSRVDELIDIVRDRITSGRDIPDARRTLMLVDRQRGTAMGITLFESEDAIRRAEPTFERMGDEIPEELRGRRTSVETYEVAIDDVGPGAQAARLSTLEGPADKIDAGITMLNEEILPKLGDVTGSRGILVLVDRTAGRTKTITFWDSAESLQASEERANQLRSEAADALQETIAGVERFEVAISEVIAGARA
jgi:hypothetical protein